MPESQHQHQGQPQTLGYQLPHEIARCKELLKQYEEIGSAGRLGHIMISQHIRAGEKAISDGDPVEMLLAYGRLKECK